MWNDFKKLWVLLTSEERRRFLGVVGVMFLAAFLQVVGIGSIHPFLQLVSEPESSLQEGILATAYSVGGFTSTQDFMVAAGVAVLLLIVLSNTLILISEYLQTRYFWDVNHSVSMRLLQTYLGKDYDYFLDHNTSEFSKNILREAEQVSRDLLRPTLRMLSRGMTAFLLVGLLFLVDPRASTFILVFIGGGFVLVYLEIKTKLREIGVEYADANEARYQTASEAFGGIKDVKLMGRESFFLDRYEGPSREVSRHLGTNRVYKLAPKYVIEALAFGGLMLLLISLLVTGSSVDSLIPLMGLFAFAGYRMMPAFRDLMNGMASFQFNREVLDILHGELKRESVSGSYLGSQGSEDPLTFEDTVDLENITFTYPGADDPAIQELSLRVPKNHAIALVGKTGAGKTTLVDLFLGLLAPDTGEVRVDGESVHPHNLRAWQNNLGYVPQSIYLADDTVRNNIAFGLPDEEIEDDRVRAAAKTAHISTFIEEELPEGYDTEVGERGVRLSGGQRQRIGIARAVYENPDVLVLDEATSDIDRKTESNITRAIDELSGEKTIVTIAHRLATVQECDRIYVIEDGEVVDEGTYAELLSGSPAFQEFTQDLGSMETEAKP